MDTNSLFEHAVPGVVQSHPKIAVALHVMSVLLETEQGSGFEGGASTPGRNLTNDELALKKSATNVLTQYLNGEAILDSLQMYPSVAERNIDAGIAQAQAASAPSIVVVRRRRK